MTQDQGRIMVGLEGFMQLPFHVYLKDKKGAYLECNTPQARSFGYQSGSDIIKKTDLEFLSKKEVEIIQFNDSTIFETGQSKIMIETATFLKKPPMSYLSYKFPVQNKSGKILGVMGTSICLDDNPIASLMSIFNNQINGQDKQDQDDSKESFNEMEGAHQTLSKRQEECLQYLIRGMTAKEIARILNLSPRTIEFYIENLKKKFGCFNRTELVAKVLNQFKYLIQD